MTGRPKVEMLNAEVDETDESEFRFLVDDRAIKYVTIDHGIWSVDELVFAHVLIPLLPDFPPGDWNVGFISRDPETSQPIFRETREEQLPGVEHIWHNVSVDVLDLSISKRHRSNLWRVSCPKTIPSTATGIIAKIARFPWETGYLENETIAYHWLDGTGVGPRFLGNVTEAGRAIGFLIENITNARHAEPGDLPLCQAAVAKLHALGLRHGDLVKYNILIANGRATLIDFDTVTKCDDTTALREEMEGLLGSLNDTSGRGGVVVVQEGDAFQEHDSSSE